MTDLDETVRALREATERLAVSEQESDRILGILRAVVDTTPDMIIVRDLEDRIVFCNDAFAKLVGRTVEALKGAALTDYFSPEEAAQVAARNREVIQGGRMMLYEEPGLRPGTYHYTVKLPLYNGSTSPTGTITIARDVTSLRA